MKHTIGIYQVKATLSKILREVREHKVAYEITDRGQPVALLSPITTEQSLDDRISDLIGAGAITAPTSAQPINPIATRKGALRRFLESRE